MAEADRGGPLSSLIPPVFLAVSNGSPDGASLSRPHTKLKTRHPRCQVDPDSLGPEFCFHNSLSLPQM